MMKTEFDKWFDNYDCADEVFCDGLVCNPACKGIRKNTWKACLEWVLTQRTAGIEETGHTFISNSIKATKIQKELDLLSNNKSN